MCAINGCSWNDSALVERMNTATVHRGPDGTRTMMLGGATLGFNRLAIIDLSERGMQPMQSADGRYTIVFNGEIFNYKELKAELPGYHFQSESDTEVILAGYVTWGSEVFARLNGQFALALWDEKEKKLLLARDPVGVKPLYYHFDGKRLIFSSEVRGILAAGVRAKLSTEAFAHYMRLMYVPKDLSIIEGIHKLLPGHLLTLHAGAVGIVLYKVWPPHASPPSYAHGATEVREAVTAAVTRQLVSDRPVGIYLSGGIDSSVILAAAAKTHPAINTFSVGFELGGHDETEKFNADSMLAKKTAAHFGTQHHEHILTVSTAGSLFSEMVAALDQPIGNATTLTQLFLAQKTKDIATVVLSGEGGDELFGGYERYRLAVLADRYARFIPSGLDGLFGTPFKHLRLTGVDRYAQLMFQKDSEVAPLLNAKIIGDTRTLFHDEFEDAADIGTALMSADEDNWLVDEALLRADTMNMVASLEARVPLLDLDVRSLAHAIPREWKVDTRRTKKILKDAFADVLPHEVLKQPKRGWFSPGAKWIRRPEFVAITDEVFGDQYTATSQLFNLEVVRQRLIEHRESRGYHFTALWAVLVFLAWAKEHNVSL